MPPAEPAIALEPGTILVGKYRVERTLGKGGMGVVVLARHVDLEECFAIKLLTGELDEDGSKRFLREARAAAQIKSDHITRVVDVGTLPEGVPYMIMEFLEGTDLAGLLDQRGQLPPAEAVDLVLQACVGLTEAHAKNFIHRDIKPANLFVALMTDGRRVVKLLDFGISKAQQDVSLTSTHAVLGTPAYMAPEQWRSAKDADVRSDVWSLGVVLYELLSGQRPFRGESVTEMCAAVLAEDSPPLAIGVPELEKIVAHCLEKEPDDRYQRIPELARDLAPFASDPEAAKKLADRMDRVAGRPSVPKLTRPATAPTQKDRPSAPETQPAPVAVPAETVVSKASRRRTLGLAVAGTAIVAAGATFALTRGDGSSSSTTPAATAPQRGGTLRIGMNRADEATVALYAGQPTRTQHALRMVLERLVVIDDSGQLEESVLEKAEIRDGGKQLVLAVRPGVMFHDSPCGPAAEATAKDLEFSILEAIELHQLDLDIDRAGITGSGRELHIPMNTPVQTYLHALSHVWLVPMKLAECEPDRTKLRHPIGTGPFKFAPSQLASTLTLARWEGYWKKDASGQPLPYLDRVELVTVPEASVAIAGLHEQQATRSLHIYITEEPSRGKLIDRATGKLIGDNTAGLEVGIRTHQGDAGMWLLEVTPKAGPLHNATLRKAIAYAIDRDAAVAKARQSAAAPARPYGRFLQSAALGHDRAIRAYGLDLEKAKQLAGDTADLPELVIGYSHDLESSRVVVSSLEALGLKVKLEKIELRDQSGVLQRGDGVDAMLLSRWGDVLGDELISIGAFDQRRIAGTRELLAELGSKAQRSDRAEVYKKIEAALLEHLPSIPIATLDPSRVTFAAIVRKQVEGFHDHASGYVPHDDSLTCARTWLRR